MLTCSLLPNIRYKEKGSFLPWLTQRVQIPMDDWSDCAAGCARAAMPDVWTPNSRNALLPFGATVDSVGSLKSPGFHQRREAQKGDPIGFLTHLSLNGRQIPSQLWTLHYKHQVNIGQPFFEGSWRSREGVRSRSS